MKTKAVVEVGARHQPEGLLCYCAVVAAGVADDLRPQPILVSNRSDLQTEAVLAEVDARRLPWWQ